MLIRFNFFLLLISAIVMLPAYASAQDKDIKPLAENASLADTQIWLTAAIRKNASYKTRATSASVDGVTFEGCKLNFTVAQKSGSTAHAVMGATTRTYTVKQKAAFDLSLLVPDDVRPTDHAVPELQTITVGFRSPDPGAPPLARQVSELVVKYEAAEQIRAALVHAHRLCVPAN